MFNTKMHSNQRRALNERAARIKSVVDIARHIERSVDLIPEGDRLYGMSPFAGSVDGRSLEVRRKDQRFNCRVTGKWGDIWDWEREFRGLTYPEAVDRLCDEYGLDFRTPEERARERTGGMAAGFLKDCKAFGLRF